MKKGFRTKFLLIILMIGAILSIFIPMLTGIMLFEYGLLPKEQFYGLLIIVFELVWVFIYLKLVSKWYSTKRIKFPYQKPLQKE